VALATATKIQPAPTCNFGQPLMHHAQQPFTSAEATSSAFWCELAPGLSIEGGGAAPSFQLRDFDSLVLTLCDEGYINTPGAFAPTIVAGLHDGIRRLHARGIPPAFAFVYDEYWRIFQSLALFLVRVLDENYRVLPDLWAWYVPPSDDAAGWVPHRDRPRATFAVDNRPNSLTVWLPLTDSTPLNGCIYVLPAHHDPDIRRSEAIVDHQFSIPGDRLQNIRALPAPAGSLLAWNQSLLHWGSRASRLGSGPRCSIALQFQRGDLPPFEKPLLDPAALPSFHDRLGLIGHLIVGFSGFLSFPPELRMLATALRWKYWAGRRA
jgi:hypothetical protein